MFVRVPVVYDDEDVKIVKIWQIAKVQDMYGCGCKVCQVSEVVGDSGLNLVINNAAMMPNQTKLQVAGLLPFCIPCHLHCPTVYSFNPLPSLSTLATPVTPSPCHPSTPITSLYVKWGLWLRFFGIMA